VNRILPSLTILLLLPAGCSDTADAMTPLRSTIDACLAQDPPRERIRLLEPLAATIAGADAVDLVFICTHNSRRSHMAQVWAQAAARHFGLEGVRTYSGGTEATAFNPAAVAALERAGFGIERRGEGDGDNPVYVVRGEGDLVMECFSKTFTDAPNPQQGFTAVMTCSDADQACPIVPGAAHRFAIPYVDPKVADGTPAEAATYDARCAQIACEMLWVMRTAAAAR
jgi:arsenate reductase